MYIKRNFKRKFNYNESVEPVRQPKEKTIKVEGNFKYPRYDEVPSGRYYSTIKAVDESKTSAGAPAFEIRYELVEEGVCYKIAIGELPEDTMQGTHHIIQKYPKTSQAYKDLIASLDIVFDGDEYDMEDIVNIGEFVTLAYDCKYSDIGGFSKRYPISWQEFLEELRAYIERRKMAYAEYEESIEDTDYTNDNAAIEEDEDDFDDFDDDTDDEW